MKRSSPRGKSPSHLTKSLLLILSLLVGTACANLPRGLEIVDVGSKTADTVGAYYESLIHDTMDIMEMNAFINTVILRRPPDIVQEQLLWQQIEALDHRKRLAQRLTSTYAALRALASRDASGKAREATESLVTTLVGTPRLPGSEANPASLFGTIAENLMAWKQTRDVQTGANLLADGLAGFSQLFDRETEAYKSIAQQRAELIGTVIDHLVQERKATVVWPLMQHIVDATGLLDASPERPIDNPETVKAIARLRAERYRMLAVGATDSMARAIAALAESHADFTEGRGLSLSGLEAWLLRVQSYLDQIAELRGEKK